MENSPDRWKTFGKIFGLAGIFGAILLESFMSMNDLITSQTEGYDQDLVCLVRNGMSFITVMHVAASASLLYGIIKKNITYINASLITFTVSSVYLFSTFLAYWLNREDGSLNNFDVFFIVTSVGEIIFNSLARMIAVKKSNGLATIRSN
ncbi:uncharacterized protein LOC116340603 [Contarinia nasturtii]|uniref:uncharacterized protein LOC116340603 n=1 Tax=Contarinia nasturtii TaxID=265458 RepID=UPI0012D3CD52|nr:uncharacterized protein LOC116340603 [Contarinia nasturtii]